MMKKFFTLSPLILDITDTLYNVQILGLRMGTIRLCFHKNGGGKKMMILKRYPKYQGQGMFIHANGWSAAGDTKETVLKMIDFLLQNHFWS